MNPLQITYVKKEAAPNQGKAKSRIHLYGYKGPKGKDVFAIAATLYKGKGAPRLNCIQKLFSTVLAVEKAGKTKWFIVNTRSLKKRLKITSSELKGVSPQGLAALINGKLQPNLEARKKREPTSPAKKEIKEPKTPVKEKTVEKELVEEKPVEQEQKPQVQGLELLQRYFDEKDWPFIKQMVGVVEVTQEESERAIEARKSGPLKDEALTLCQIGFSLLRLNNNKEAEEYFKKALQKDPKKVENYQNSINNGSNKFLALVRPRLGQINHEVNQEREEMVKRLNNAVNKCASIQGTINGIIDVQREFSVINKVAAEEEKPLEKELVKENPVEEKPLEKELVKENPVEEKPVEKEPVKENPVEERPVEKELVKEKPIEKEPLAAPVPQSPQVQGLEPLEGNFNPKYWKFVKRMVDRAETTKENLEEKIEGLKKDPLQDEALTLCHIGCNLLRLNKKKEAKEYFKKALQKNPKKVKEFERQTKHNVELFSSLVNTDLLAKLFEEEANKTSNLLLRLLDSLNAWEDIQDRVSQAIDEAQGLLDITRNPPVQ